MKRPDCDALLERDHPSRRGEDPRDDHGEDVRRGSQPSLRRVGNVVEAHLDYEILEVVHLGGLVDWMEVGGRHDRHVLRRLGHRAEEAHDGVGGIGHGLHEPQG